MRKGPKDRFWEPERPKRGDKGYQSRLEAKIAQAKPEILQRVLDEPAWNGPFTPTQARILRRDHELGLPMAIWLYRRGLTLDQLLSVFRKQGFTRTWLYKELYYLNIIRPLTGKRVRLTAKRVTELMEEYLREIEVEAPKRTRRIKKKKRIKRKRKR